MTTKFQLHCGRWKDGCGSAHCAAAQHRVLYRGKIPCDVLFIAEAPGESEDCVGTPLEGPAGHKLDQIIERALAQAPARPDGRPWRVGFTNLVGCIPRDDGGLAKAADGPDDDQVGACTPRLQEIVRIADPALLVLVGKQSQSGSRRGTSTASGSTNRSRRWASSTRPRSCGRTSPTSRWRGSGAWSRWPPPWRTCGPRSRPRP